MTFCLCFNSSSSEPSYTASASEVAGSKEMKTKKAGTIIPSSLGRGRDSSRIKKKIFRDVTRASRVFALSEDVRLKKAQEVIASVSEGGKAPSKREVQKLMKKESCEYTGQMMRQLRHPEAKQAVAACSRAKYGAVLPRTSGMDEFITIYCSRLIGRLVEAHGDLLKKESSSQPGSLSEKLLSAVKAAIGSKYKGDNNAFNPRSKVAGFCAHKALEENFSSFVSPDEQWLEKAVKQVARSLYAENARDAVLYCYEVISQFARALNEVEAIEKELLSGAAADREALQVRLSHILDTVEIFRMRDSEMDKLLRLFPVWLREIPPIEFSTGEIRPSVLGSLYPDVIEYSSIKMRLSVLESARKRLSSFLGLTRLNYLYSTVIVEKNRSFLRGVVIKRSDPIYQRWSTLFPEKAIRLQELYVKGS